MGICPKCGDKDFGGHTVLNIVDKVFQVPSLIIRINRSYHSYILECSNCKIVYECSNNVVLNPDEVEECNTIWENYKDC